MIQTQTITRQSSYRNTLISDPSLPGTKETIKKTDNNHLRYHKASRQRVSAMLPQAITTNGGVFGNYFPFDETFTLGRPLERRIEPVPTLILCDFVNVPPMFRAGGAREDVRLDGAVLVPRRGELISRQRARVTERRLSSRAVTRVWFRFFGKEHGLLGHVTSFVSSCGCNARIEVELKQAQAWRLPRILCTEPSLHVHGCDSIPLAKISRYLVRFLADVLALMLSCWRTR